MSAKRDSAMLHEYIAAIHAHGCTVTFDQVMHTATPQRPSQYVHIIYVHREGTLVFSQTGLSLYRIATEALQHLKHG